MRHLIRQTALLLCFLTLLTGFFYPVAITGLSSVFFHYQATGSLIIVDGRVMGSELIGQSFEGPRYFWSRPSATTPFPYHGASSAGSNWGPSSPELINRIHNRIHSLYNADPRHPLPMPVDLVTSSGSGLDPHISPAAALYQVPRVADSRGLDEMAVRRLVLSHIRERTFGILGEPVVSVLTLNMALDNLR